MIVQFLRVICNIGFINAVFLLSFLFRYGMPLPSNNFGSYEQNYAFLTFLYLLAFAMVRCFQKSFRSYWDLFSCTFKGMFLGTLFGLALVYVLRARWASFPSSVFLISFPLGVLIIFTANALILRLTDRIKKKVLIIGKGNIKGILDENGITENIYIDKAEDILKHEDAHEVVLCEQPHDDNQMNLLIYLLLKLKINVVFSPALYAKLLSGSVMEENSLKYIATSLGKRTDIEEFFIRLLDMVMSIIILIIFSPLIFLSCILIKVVSQGPVIFKQRRIAKDGEEFVLYKLRTMVDGAEVHTGPVIADENDHRVTNIGRFLRQTRLDELPQLVNVIKGQMSLVGPRPERPHFVKQHKALRQIRLAVKPGLTGFAQIRNSYDLHPKHKIKYDYLYIQKRSLLLNLYILLKTISVVLSKKGR